MSGRSRSAAAVAALLILIGVFYLRPELLSGAAILKGTDFALLHVRRMAFAREALFGSRHTIPGWYPHEVMGTPFAANLQSFPWIPTRLILLFFDPPFAYAAGVTIAAFLSALFTFLYCRRSGMCRIAAMAAGGTFACAGYFASRVLAGHLPLLEAYPALPLLLWLTDRALLPERAQGRRRDLAWLALATLGVALAGHPQIPAYSIFSAMVYAIWMGRGWVRARVIATIGLGIGLTMAAWWPMLLLIGRSTRILHLAPAANDVSLPYSRLLALLVPGIQGWAQPVEAANTHPFRGFPNGSYFWDTASYIGILPLAATMALFIFYVGERRMPERRGQFLILLGASAFLGSLPFAAPFLHLLPGTLLRSPARLLYLSTFCIAVALGRAIEILRSSTVLRRGPFAVAILSAVLLVHFADLWIFTNHFIVTTPWDSSPQSFENIVDREVGNGRVALEWSDYFPWRDRYDDVGGFDSIFLARFDETLRALDGSAPGLNRQKIDGSELSLKALQATGVGFVLTTETRNDLTLASTDEDAYLYEVPDPAPRTAFFTESETEYRDGQKIPALFASDIRGPLLLSSAAQLHSPATTIGTDTEAAHAALEYLRPSSDEIVLRASTDRAGFARILEAYDPGWKATVDGASATVIPADGFAMAIQVAKGSHMIRLRYDTPGRTTGVVLSTVSLALLAGIIFFAPRHE